MNISSLKKPFKSYAYLGELYKYKIAVAHTSNVQKIYWTKFINIPFNYTIAPKSKSLPLFGAL